MGLSDYLPVAVAGCCAAAVAYVALSQAFEADSEGAADSPSTSQSAEPTKAEVNNSAVLNGKGAKLDQHAAVAGTSSSTSSSSSSSGSRCDHCMKVPEGQQHLLKCSRCHHAWYCSKVRLLNIISRVRLVAAVLFRYFHRVALSFDCHAINPGAVWIVLDRDQ